MKLEYFEKIAAHCAPRTKDEVEEPFRPRSLKQFLKALTKKKLLKKSGGMCCSGISLTLQLALRCLFYILWDSSICSTLKSIFGSTKEKFESKLYIL